MMFKINVVQTDTSGVEQNVLWKYTLGTLGMLLATRLRDIRAVTAMTNLTLLSEYFRLALFLQLPF